MTPDQSLDQNVAANQTVEENCPTAVTTISASHYISSAAGTNGEFVQGKPPQNKYFTLMSMNLYSTNMVIEWVWMLQ